MSKFFLSLLFLWFAGFARIDLSAMNLVCSEYSDDQQALFVSDPRIDLRLHPHKGHTVFFDEDRECQITCARAPYHIDVLSVSRGLDFYDREKLRDIAVSLVFTDRFIDPVGRSINSTLIIDELPFEQIDMASLSTFLEAIEVCALNCKLKQIIFCVPEYKNKLCSKEVIFLLLRNKGFAFSGTILEEIQEDCWRKVLGSHDQSVQTHNIRLVPYDKTYEVSINNENAVGFFVRDRIGSVVGGALALVVSRKNGWHLYLEQLWVDASCRGHGYGKKLLELLESFARENQIGFITVSSEDHQAPWLYEKMGFKKRVSIPYIQKNDETWINCNNYFKKL